MSNTKHLTWEREKAYIIAMVSRGESALWSNSQLLQWRILTGLFDAVDHSLLVLQLRDFRGDDAQHHLLVTFRQEAQWLKAACARVVEFQQICVA